MNQPDQDIQHRQRQPCYLWVVTKPDESSPKVRPDWPAVRLAYINGEGSLRELSQRFGVPLRTLERRCSQDGWRRAIQRTGGVVAAVAAEVAAREGERLAMDAAGLVAKSIVLVEKALREIESKLGAGTSSAAELRLLIAAMKDAIGIGRQTFGLDCDQPSYHLHYHGAGQPDLVPASAPGPIIDMPRCA